MNNSKRKPDSRTLQVLEALNLLGGCGSPKAIYKVMDCSEWGTKTPQATIRQKLQMSRGTLFFQLEKGVWCTLAYMQNRNDMNALSERISKVEKEKHKITVSVSSDDPEKTEVMVEAVDVKKARKEKKETKKPTPPSVTERGGELDKYIVVYDLKDKVYDALDKYLKSKTGVNAMMVMVAVCSINAMHKPSHSRFDARYKGVVRRNVFYKYISNENAFDAEELRKMKNNLCDEIGLPRPE